MLRARLFLAVLPFVIVLLALGFVAIELFSRLATRVDATVTENYQSIALTHTMSQALSQMEKEVHAASIIPAPQRKTFIASQKQFEDVLNQQLKRVPLGGEAELNEQLKTNYAAFTKELNKLNPVRSPKDQVNRVGSFSMLGRMSAALDRIRSLHYRAVLATSRGVQQTTQDVTRVVMIGMGIVLVLSILTCYQLSRSILRPIQSLTRATRELGEGDLSHPVPVTSKDELGELAACFNKMAAQLEDYRRQTSEEIVRLHRTTETTLASFPDPIFVLNNEGQIELKNPAAADLASALQLNGELPNPLQFVARKALQSGENFLPHTFNEVISYRVNDAETFFLPRVLAMRDKNNALFGVAVVLYDVTRFRLLDAAKTNLVATVSHELNTPLTSVRMALHLLSEKSLGSLSARQDELVQTARNNTERLLRIFNDLMDLARLEEGNGDLRKEKVFPGELLQGVIEDAVDKISSRGLKVTCSVEPDLPAVSVDRQRISHVFNNLITNAIKYSPAGGEIAVRAERAEDNSVQFSVTDQGSGIPEEYQGRIFDRFFRVPGQTKTGAGLGLSIAREITVAHGGRISVKSAPGAGTTFFVVLKALERSAESAVSPEMNGHEEDGNEIAPHRISETVG